MWLTNILSAVSKPITAWVEGNQNRKTLEAVQEGEVRAREHELNVKKIDVNMELAKAGMKIEADWDTTAQKQMTTTWKDEWFVLLFSTPLVMAFIPSLQNYVLVGFTILAETPDWYMWLVAGIVSATFGLRWMFGKLNIKK